jgi:hypothetical protein
MYHRAGAGLKRPLFTVLLLSAAVVLMNCRTLDTAPPAGYPVPEPAGALAVVSAEITALSGEFELSLRRVAGEDIWSSISRAERMSLAILPEAGLTLLLEGRYPRFLTALSLNLNRDWKRVPGSPGRWRLKGGGGEIALVKGGVLAVGFPGVQPMVEAYRTGTDADYLRSSDFLLVIPAVEKLSSGLPVSGECVVRGTFLEDGVAASLQWRFPDELRARVSLPLVKLAVWTLLSRSDPGFSRDSLKTELDGAVVRMDGFMVGSAGVETILKMVFPDQVQRSPE